MDILVEQIGKRMFERRKQLRMTQEELAEKADVTPQTISVAELGKKTMRADTIIHICSALDISTDYLLHGEITNVDISILSQKVSQLTPGQYRHLEEIIDSYIAAVNEREA